ncbi:MAG: hypothetical protein D6726_05930 [Nitrospirae bacterium]|nr:MAG: hypothetical protein D6726_05930 [Nitrospirota bacterium]
MSNSIRVAIAVLGTGFVGLSLIKEVFNGGNGSLYQGEGILIYSTTLCVLIPYLVFSIRRKRGENKR